MKTIEIQDRKIGNNHPPFIIAEMSGNHNQSLERALEIVEIAERQGKTSTLLATHTKKTLRSRSYNWLLLLKTLWQQTMATLVSQLILLLQTRVQEKFHRKKARLTITKLRLSCTPKAIIRSKCSNKTQHTQVVTTNTTLVKINPLSRNFVISRLHG